MANFRTLIANHLVGGTLVALGVTAACQRVQATSDDRATSEMPTEPTSPGDLASADAAAKPPQGDDGNNNDADSDIPGDDSDASSSSSSSGSSGSSGDNGNTGGSSGSSGDNGSSSGSSGSSGSSSGGSSGSGNGGDTVSAERAVAKKLGLPERFLFGLGNDSEGNSADQVSAYNLGPKLDIHYMYLSGFDWTTWNSPEGQYVTMHVNSAKSHGVVPMFTLYQAAASGEGNLGAFNDTSFMTKYWNGVRVMYRRLGEFGSPAIVHLEPDFWGYCQQTKGDDPANMPVKVGTIVAECSDLPENVAGMGKCAVRLARTLAPKVVVGLSASTFGAYTNGASDAARIAAYLKKIGGDDADITVVETLDRDAGCFEAATDPNCKRSGTFYWDESNATKPNFKDHFAWTKAIRDGVGKPLLWWQTPLGAPSSTKGGSSGKYRDNRVHYFFAHPDELVASGGIGAVFGTGAGNQTTAKTDGGQFKDALTRYLTQTVSLP